MRSVYIHIPFCTHICSYCDFCKIYYNEDLVIDYLNALEKEINNYYHGEEIMTLYIGGGTPSSLNMTQLERLFQILNKFKLSDDIEFTFECNIENIDKNKLEFLYNNGVNRLSIGIETFNQEHLLFLERHHSNKEVFEKMDIAKKVGFSNINIDLIYAITNQTIDDLKQDLELFLKLDIPHISTYSLIIEPHTKLYINKTNNIDEDLDYDMFSLISKTLDKNNYKHYEISNFAKPGYESKHNLTYWNNKEYYGFGLGASGYVDDVRYDNTRSIKNYLKNHFRLTEEKLDLNTKLQNELILGFRKLDGINKNEFYDKYGIQLNQLDVIDKLIKEKKLMEDKNMIYINNKDIYVSNDILIQFLDKNI